MIVVSIFLIVKSSVIEMHIVFIVFYLFNVLIYSSQATLRMRMLISVLCSIRSEYCSLKLSARLTQNLRIFNLEWAGARGITIYNSLATLAGPSDKTLEKVGTVLEHWAECFEWL